MTPDRIEELLKKYLEGYAAATILSECQGCDPMGASGGNYDDCYGIGVADGETILARRILQSFFNEKEEGK